MNPKPPFKHEEHAFRWYASRVSGKVGMPSLDLVSLRGVEFKDQCEKCGKVGKWKKQDGVWRCRGFRCGAPRPQKIVAFGRDTTYDSGSPTLERIADLGVAFQRLTLWEFRAWWVYVALGSYRQTFRFCSSTWSRRKAGWSLRGVQDLVESARDKSRPVLERKGLI